MALLQQLCRSPHGRLDASNGFWTIQCQWGQQSGINGGSEHIVPYLKGSNRQKKRETGYATTRGSSCNWTFRRRVGWFVNFLSCLKGQEIALRSTDGISQIKPGEGLGGRDAQFFDENERLDWGICRWCSFCYLEWWGDKEGSGLWAPNCLPGENWNGN